MPAGFASVIDRADHAGITAGATQDNPLAVATGIGLVILIVVKRRGSIGPNPARPGTAQACLRPFGRIARPRPHVGQNGSTAAMASRRCLPSARAFLPRLRAALEGGLFRVCDHSRTRRFTVAQAQLCVIPGHLAFSCANPGAGEGAPEAPSRWRSAPQIGCAACPVGSRRSVFGPPGSGRIRTGTDFAAGVPDWMSWCESAIRGFISG